MISLSCECILPKLFRRVNPLSGRGQLVIVAVVSVAPIGHDDPHVTLIVFPVHDGATDRLVETGNRHTVANFKHLRFSLIPYIDILAAFLESSIGKKKNNTMPKQEIFQKISKSLTLKTLDQLRPLHTRRKVLSHNTLQQVRGFFCFDYGHFENAKKRGVV